MIRNQYETSSAEVYSGKTSSTRTQTVLLSGVHYSYFGCPRAFDTLAIGHWLLRRKNDDGTHAHRVHVINE